MTPNNANITHRFEGKWTACSIFEAVEAPLGDELFGGRTVLAAAEKDLKSELCYFTRFKSVPSPFPDGGTDDRVIIGDRLYNVEQIAIASMGKNSIVDDVQKVRCIFSCYISCALPMSLFFVH
jgi:hypothetical protein